MNRCRFVLRSLAGLSAAMSLLAADRLATPAEKLDVVPGFKVKLLRSAAPGEGSWVCMAVDDKGRLIISPQEGVSNLLRITLTSLGQIEQLETLRQPVGSAMGLLYAFNSLYLSGRGPDGLGLYRLKDTDGNDLYDQTELLRRFDKAGGEHGSHALVLGPDDKLYYMHGNFVRVPEDVSAQSPHRNYAEDQLLPRGEDGNGFGVGIKPPGGFVLRMDRDARHCELFAAGLRNTYDMDFNADGELFGFDSDMEWDWGMPWYRPTRINHLVSGGDYGFREGTGKFPVSHPDSLPSTVDIGIGSPTGVKFGTKSNFPKRYREALFAMDWSYGRILAVHLQPEGATYRGSFENFVAPASLRLSTGKATLNVTDLEFGRDGAMYFLTGGRGTQSGLYRVSYTGAPTPAAVVTSDSGAAVEARRLRRQLEAFHGKRSPGAVDLVWKHLGESDRWIRYAARVALETQPVELWQERALREEQVDAALTALLALARVGPSELQVKLLEALDALPSSTYTEDQALVALRILALSFIRMGWPGTEVADVVVQRLEGQYPAQSWALNRELSQILIYLKAPGVVAKTLALLDSAPSQEEQIHYLFQLRSLKTGWTLAQRQRYLARFDRDWRQGRHPAEVRQWFTDVGRESDNGASFPKFLVSFRKDAIASLSGREREQLAAWIERPALPLAPPDAPARAYVRDWTVAELLPMLDQVSAGRNLNKGRDAFTAAQCAACHRFDSEGGAAGPELTALTSRFTRRDILESILEPSKVVSEQYQNSTVFKKDGDDLTGRVVEETADRLVLVTNPLTEEKATVRKGDIRDVQPSKLSPMPAGLLNSLTETEILDLLAFLESNGRQDRAAATGQ